MLVWGWVGSLWRWNLPSMADTLMMNLHAAAQVDAKWRPALGMRCGCRPVGHGRATSAPCLTGTCRLGWPALPRPACACGCRACRCGGASLAGARSRRHPRRGGRSCLPMRQRAPMSRGKRRTAPRTRQTGLQPRRQQAILAFRAERIPRATPRCTCGAHTHPRRWTRTGAPPTATCNRRRRRSSSRATWAASGDTQRESASAWSSGAMGGVVPR